MFYFNRDEGDGENPEYRRMKEEAEISRGFLPYSLFSLPSSVFPLWPPVMMPKGHPLCPCVQAKKSRHREEGRGKVLGT